MPPGSHRRVDAATARSVDGMHVHGTVQHVLFHCPYRGQPSTRRQLARLGETPGSGSHYTTGSNGTCSPTVGPPIPSLLRRSQPMICCIAGVLTALGRAHVRARRLRPSSLSIAIRVLHPEESHLAGCVSARARAMVQAHGVQSQSSCGPSSIASTRT